MIDGLDPEHAASRSDFDIGPPFVFGFSFHGDRAEEMRWEDAATAEGDWVWLHLNMNNAATRDWINARHDIPFAAARALLADETRPRVTGVENGIVVNLRGVNLNEGAEPEDMVSIRIWIESRRVITTRRRRLKAAQDIRAEILAGRSISGPGALIVRLASQMTDRTEPFVAEIEEAVDALEVRILEGERPALRGDLGEVRQTAVHFRRFIAPQREALVRLAADDSKLFDSRSRIELREIADRVTRFVEDIDAVRERAMVLQDQLTDQRAEEMNRNMMILSVVAAIFLPLGFLTGLLGINVGGMPGAEHPGAFWIVVAICAAVGAALVYYFKRRNWL